MLFPCTCFALLIDKLAGGDEDSIRPNKHFGPWLDPYGLAQAPAPEDGKKTYYLVDGETNAIVDVLHLGKRAEARLLRRVAKSKEKEAL